MKMFKRFLNLLLIVAVFAAVLFITQTGAAAEAAYWETDATGAYLLESYEDLKTAIKMSNKNTVFRLNNDIYQNDTDNDNMLVIDGYNWFILDLNGYSLTRETYSMDNSLFHVKSGALRIFDSSKGRTGSCTYYNKTQRGPNSVIQNSGGDMYILGGNYYIKTLSDAETSCTLYLSGGYTGIDGGTFNALGARGGFSLWVSHGSEYKDPPFCLITGGTFYGKNSGIYVCAKGNYTSKGVRFPTVYVIDAEFYLTTNNPKDNGSVYISNKWGHVYLAGGFFPAASLNDCAKYLDGADIESFNNTFEGATLLYNNVTPPPVIIGGGVSELDRLNELCEKADAYDYMNSYNTVTYKNTYSEVLEDTLNYVATIYVNSYDANAPTLKMENVLSGEKVKWYFSSEANYKGTSTVWSELADYENNVDGWQLDYRPVDETTLYFKARVERLDGTVYEDVIKVVFEEYLDSMYVNEVEITNLAAPKKGEYPDYTVTLGESSKYSASVVWYEDNKEMSKYDVFENGHSYMVVINLQTKGSFKFLTNDSGYPLVNGSVNGENGAVTKAFGADGTKNLIMGYSFGTLNDIVVERADIMQIALPVSGKTPDYYAYVDGDGCYVSDDNYSDYKKNGIVWYDVTDISNPKLVRIKDRFVAGHTYKVMISLTAYDGYVFANSNGEITADGYINGTYWRKLTTPGNYEKYATMEYSFTCTTDVINTILVEGLTLPAEGKTPDLTIDTAYPDTYMIDQNYGMGGIYWYDSEGLIMGENDKFVAGETYSVEIKIVPAKLDGVNVCKFGSASNAFIDDLRLSENDVFAGTNAAYLYATYKCYTNSKPVFTTSGGMSMVLNLEDIVRMKVYYALADMSVYDLFREENFGILVWKEVTGLTLETAVHGNPDIAYEVQGAVYDEAQNRFMSVTEGIPAKMMGDALSFRTFYKNADGTYTYGRLIDNYNPMTYCENSLKKDDEALKKLCIAIANYGAAAQVNFDYKTDKLMNEFLTDAQKAYKWNPALVNTIDFNVPAAKEGIFTRDKSIIDLRQANVSLEGAIDYNFMANAGSKEILRAVAYFWTEADYNAANVLTTENASSSTEIEYNETYEAYYAKYSGVPAKKMFENVYCTIGFETTDGVYYSGVVCYTPARYAYLNMNKTDNSGNLTANALLARTLCIYGDAARTYFGS